MIRWGRWIGTAIFVLALPAQAQTYFGLLGPGSAGSCCTGTAQSDVSNLPVPPDYPGWSVITKAQYDQALAAMNAPGAVNIEARLHTGVAFTFTSLGASGTYAADQASIELLEKELLRFVAIGTFSGGGATIPIRDTSGATHVVSGLIFKTIFATLQDYNVGVHSAARTAVANGTAPIWPTATAISTQ